MSVVLDINRIGLVIWGVRNGHRVFCSNAAIADPEVPEIKSTWGDIRKLLVVNNYSVFFYALEFSKNYKVYTIYNPVNDFGRSGAYVAVSIYVPHSFKLQSVREIMEAISRAYIADHYSYGEPLNVPDNIYPYQQILNGKGAFLSVDDEFRIWRESEQNHLPKLLPYNDLSVVDAFFNTPYREDFAPYQEIMFWNLNYLQNPAQFGITFQRELERFQLNGTDVSEEYQGESLSIPSSLFLSSFSRNGEDCTNSYNKKKYYGATHIAFTLSKNEYSLPVSFDGTVDEAVYKGFLMKSGKSYEWRTSIMFEPKVFPLRIRFAGLETAPGILKAGVDEKSLFIVKNGTLDLELRGDEVQFQKTLIVEEYGLFRRIKSFVPEELPRVAGAFTLEVDSLQFVSFSFIADGQGRLPSSVACRISGFEGTATFDPRNTIGFFLLKGQDLSDVDFYAEKYKTIADAGRILFKKTHVVIRIVLPQKLQADILKSGGRFGIRSVDNTLKLLEGLETGFPYDSLPRDRKIQLFYFPDGINTRVYFPFESSEFSEDSGEIVLTPTMMRVICRNRVSFWVGNQTVENRSWVARDGRSFNFIPASREFSSDEKGFRYEIAKKEGYYELYVACDLVRDSGGKGGDVPPNFNRKVGEVFFYKEGKNENVVRITVLEKDRESEGIYRVNLSREKGLSCYLPFPYDENKFARARGSFDSRLTVTPSSGESYKIALKSGIAKGGGRYPEKKPIPSWFFYLIGGASLVIILVAIWFFLIYKGPKVGVVSFKARCGEDSIPVAIISYPKYTRASGDQLTIYKKYEKKVNRNKEITGVKIGFGDKKSGLYDYGELLLKNRKYTDEVSIIHIDTIPSLLEIEKASSLDSIKALICKYPGVKKKGLEKAQGMVLTDTSLFAYYVALFQTEDTTSFISEMGVKISGDENKRKNIENKEKNLVDAYENVQKMTCSAKTVKTLKEAWDAFKHAGGTCEKKYELIIREYENFFTGLTKYNYDAFKSGFDSDKKTRKKISNYLSPGQKAVFDDIIDSAGSFGRGYTGYNLRNKKTFQELKDYMSGNN